MSCVNLDTYTPEEVLGLYKHHRGTVTALVESRSEREPNEIMLIDPERTLTRGQVVEASKRLAGYFQTLGVSSGDRIALVAENSRWHVLTLLAASRLNAIFVPLNPETRGTELAYPLQKARPTVILTTERLSETVNSVSADTLEARIVILGDVLLDATPCEVDLGTPDSDAIIIFTSGTTGYPKGAVHSQNTLLLSGESFVSRVRLQPHDRCLTILPLFHINAMFYSVMGALTAGARLIIEPKFSASKFWKTVEDYGITQTNMIEAVGAILLKRSDGALKGKTTLRKIYGIRDALMKPFRERFGVPYLVGGYGMTEVPGVLATPYDQPNQPGSMGSLASHPGQQEPLAQCRVVEDGSGIDARGVGELWVKTPTVMKRYFDEPEQTLEAFEGQWFKTGDLVRQDDNGWFYFVARKKDIIRCRGENISGAELDRVIAGHPDIVLAAAIGVPASLGDEDILVAVTVRNGATITASDIADYARGSLSEIKVPRYVYIAKDLPLTSTGKVAKHALKKDNSLLENAVDIQA